MTVKISAAVCDHTMPYIPKTPSKIKSMGMFSTSQRETPRKNALSPLPKA